MSDANSYYDLDGYPLRCPNCRSTGTRREVRDFLDVGVPGGGPPTEIEYFCAECKTSVAYWAYGAFDPAYLLDDMPAVFRSNRR